VIDAGQPAREASWAGAGILPPASASVDDPLEQLTALSNELHRKWSDELRSSVGIDNGFRRCGAVYLARDGAGAQALDAYSRLAAARRIVAQRLSRDELAAIEPGLDPSGSELTAYFVPDECQVRNPRHLKALLVGCAMRGVEVTPGAAAEDFEIVGRRVRSVRTGLGSFAADRVCLTTGVGVSVRPVRGQMVLFAPTRPVLGRIVNEGSRYLVPRAEGRVLCGSTEEDVGFDRGTTAGAIGGLLQFAFGLAPELGQSEIERTWAGLRPSTADGLPYLGRAGHLENAFVAAGHFRSGLQLSTGTAIVMSQLIRGQRPQIDLTKFSPDRDRAAVHGEPKRARHEVPLY
jgi:glycine oxidase